jgi:hypothetical protein
MSPEQFTREVPGRLGSASKFQTKQSKSPGFSDYVAAQAEIEGVESRVLPARIQGAQIRSFDPNLTDIWKRNGSKLK